MRYKVQDKPIPTVESMALSSEGVARELGVSPKTLANWRCAGRGPAYVHIGDPPRSPVLYLVEDLEGWLHSRRRCGGVSRPWRACVLMVWSILIWNESTAKVLVATCRWPSMTR